MRWQSSLSGGSMHLPMGKYSHSPPRPSLLTSPPRLIRPTTATWQPGLEYCLLDENRNQCISSSIRSSLRSLNLQGSRRGHIFMDISEDIGIRKGIFPTSISRSSIHSLLGRPISRISTSSRNPLSARELERMISSSQEQRERNGF